MLSTAGDQVPEMLLVLVAGKLNASPLQMSEMGVKLGVLCAFTLTVIVSIAVSYTHLTLPTKRIV